MLGGGVAMGSSLQCSSSNSRSSCASHDLGAHPDTLIEWTQHGTVATRVELASEGGPDCTHHEHQLFIHFTLLHLPVLLLYVLWRRTCLHKLHCVMLICPAGYLVASALAARCALSHTFALSSRQHAGAILVIAVLPLFQGGQQIRPIINEHGTGSKVCQS